MNIPSVIIFLGVIVILSHVFTYFFDKTHIPNVLLLMLIGIIIGPVTGWVEGSVFGMTGPVFSNIVLLFILFESGANLKLKELKQAVLGSLLLTILMFSGTLLIIAGLCHYVLKFDWISSALTGAVLGGTSSAIVIPMIRPIKIPEETRSLLLIESALSDVFCLIAGLALFIAMKSGFFNIGSILSGIGFTFIISLIIGFAGGIFWSFLIGKLRPVQNSIFITGAYVFIVYGLTEYIGYNGGFAVLILGITLGNIKNSFRILKRNYGKEIESINGMEKKFFGEIVFIFATYFFVYMGITIQFGSYTTYIFAAIATILLFFFRYIAVKVAIRSEAIKKNSNVILAVAPKGLIPAILASLPLQEGLKFGAQIREVVFAIILMSIIISSVLVFMSQRPEKKMNTSLNA